MPTLVASISALAVWGSIGSSTILCCYLFVQGWFDTDRRGRFFLFGFLMLGTVILDLLFPLFPTWYELSRLILWAWYPAAVLLLFDRSSWFAFAAGASAAAVGGGAWILWSPDRATSVQFPFIFCIAAWVHFLSLRRNQGFASCVLLVCSLAQAFMCGLFYAVITSGPNITALGYLHYTIVSATGVLFGWVHVAREIRGRSPVRISRISRNRFILAYGVGEFLCLPCLLLAKDFGVTLYTVGTLVQLAAVFSFFLFYRHLLVIHTDNVAALLEERTASLTLAQAELAAQNTIQAARLMEQEISLKEKSEVIERQRRLELAAQTAGQAAHDIQNILAPLSGAVAQLEKSARNGHSTDTGVVRRILAQTKQLYDLNGQLLALARRGVIHTGPVQLQEVVTAVVEQLGAHPVEIKTDPALYVHGNLGQLQRALANLALNGIDASPGTVLRISMQATTVSEIRRCHLGFLQPGAYAVLVVADQGRGIPVGSLDRIFEPFFSSKDGMGRSGTGLGLSIVAAVVDDHKGVLDLHTSATGTRFEMYLPLLERTECTVAGSGDERVLIISLAGSVQDVAGCELRSLGYLVEEVQTRRAAIQSLQAHDTDIVLIMCSVVDGIIGELVLALLNIRPSVHFVIVTAEQSGSAHHQVAAFGNVDLLQMPTSVQEIGKSIRFLRSAVPV